MIGGFLSGKVVKRFGRGLPIIQVWVLGQLALLAGRHLAKLTPEERRRLATLVARGRGRPSHLSDADAAELRRLVGKLEPRLFAGHAVTRLSPVPVPKRLLYGNRKNPARVAAGRQRQRRQET
ncbi:MAG: hypothetical protein JWO02_474 [Solirubrobacterales bacterium]|nr:hypothetical protein [Solirubrobacterales bacterium]